MLSTFKKLFQREPIVVEPKLPVPETTESGESAEEKDSSWIAVDLDGTLAFHDGWKGFNYIGRPVPLMMARVKEWIADGYTVKILTARASIPEHIPVVEKWLEKHGLGGLEVTNAKDFDMIECWDDRSVQVLPNTGRPVVRPSIYGRPRAPLLNNESPDETCVVERRMPSPQQREAQQAAKDKEETEETSG